MNIKNIFLCILLIHFFHSENFAQNSDFELDREPPQYCVNDTVKFINNSTDNLSQIWAFGNGYETYAENPKHIYSNPGTYTISLTVFDEAGNSDISEKIITISPLPEINLFPENDTTIFFGQSLIITASGNYDEILWSTGETENEITITNSGNYSALVINITGCKNSDSLNVYLQNTDDFDDIKIQTLNNILTPNKDGINDYLIVKDLYKFETPCEIFIYDISGKLVYSNADYQNNWNGKSSNNMQLERGTYYFVLKNQNKIGGTGFIDIIF